MTFKIKILLGLGAALVAVGGMSFMSYQSTLLADADRLSVAHTHLVLEALDAVRTDLVGAETGQRGYLLAGDESYFEAYNLSLGHVQQDLNKVRELTADNPMQQRSLDHLEPLITARLAKLKNGIELRKQGNLTGATEANGDNSGKRLIDQLGVELLEMKQEERRLLTKRSEAADAASRKTQEVSFIGGALSIIFLCLCGLIICREIDRWTRAEDALRLSEERFRLLIEGVQDYAIFLLSPDGHVVSWNTGAERINGYQATEIIGKHFSCFYPPEAIAQGKPELALRRALVEGHAEDENLRIRKGGQQFWANVVITGLFDNKGSLRGFSKITRDITERKRIERVLYDKTIQLQHAAEAKDRFLANMSHELRTPLNGIIGFAEFLVDGKPGSINPEQKEDLEDILNSGKHLLQLINDVLDLAKVGAGKIELNPERFVLREAIAEVCNVAGAIAQKKRIQIEIAVAPDLAQVTLDQQKLKQVLYNLLSNAIKFTDEGGKVQIRAAMHEAHRVRLEVKDTGIGINPEDVERLFQDFEQLDSGPTRRYQGTGLGLVLTRKIVEFQGGAIHVESEVGKGSSFTVELPLVTDETARIGV
ncbi:MAG: CHASE3 domain-containing protein [Verrucomicrobia bacterium]|nr:CHASE3 domain-containing protein [Verrucomicrobiota bacterium]